MQKITKITTGIVAITLLGLATASLAEDKKKPVMQTTPKSCTWIGATGDKVIGDTKTPPKDTGTGKVFASGGTTTDHTGATWKCNNGSWSQVGGPPAKDTRPGQPKT